MTTTIANIDHVMIATPPDGENAARLFYSEILGLVEMAKPAALITRGGLWYQVGALQLHLGIDREFRPARKAHVAFIVSNLPGLRQQVIDAGLTVIDDDLLPGFDRFYLDDPFGNRLEFLEPLAEIRRHQASR